MSFTEILIKEKKLVLPDLKRNQLYQLKLTRI
jgi:hypothetical protein